MECLACLIKPEVRCIGCDIPLCTAHFKGVNVDNNLPKCKSTYYYKHWIYDASGHAFNGIENLPTNRLDEAKEREWYLENSK